MSPELIGLAGILIGAIPALAALWVSRKKGPAEATDVITQAAERAGRNLLADNDRLLAQLNVLRSDLDRLRNDLTVAKARITELEHALSLERVEHEETREQVGVLRRELAKFTPPDGTPAVGK